ncbi:MAG: sigma-70 family RNA polymerase sigma factor [Phycisphaerae bacterium]|nr:sigma-70 family RNA polymerase sigma factor [Phycisphaerae bacterium]
MLTAETTTILLREVQRGKEAARSALLEGVYGELRALAGSMLRGQGNGQTLQPTALVHEAWLKLGAATGLQIQDRAHFMAIAATAMRQILVDQARARNAAKRGGGARRLSLDDLSATSGDTAPEDVIAIDDCLKRLEALDARQARVVEMRVFAGMTVPETAEALSVSTRTVELDWRMARAWLARELSHAHT